MRKEIILPDKGLSSLVVGRLTNDE